MLTKKFKGGDLTELLNDMEKSFPNVKKELQQMLTRQKQRYAVNTLLEEYELVLSITVKKQRK